MVQFTRIIKVVGEHWCQNFDLFFSGVSASEVITDRLEAKSAFIEELQVSKPIVTQRGDIAYHFKLDAADHDLPLEEGDIVGVIEGPDGKSHIEKLTHFNASKATMAGVISRSAYLEAKTPAEEENKGKRECTMFVHSQASPLCCLLHWQPSGMTLWLTKFKLSRKFDLPDILSTCLIW